MGAEFASESAQPTQPNQPGIKEITLADGSRMPLTSAFDGNAQTFSYNLNEKDLDKSRLPTSDQFSKADVADVVEVSQLGVKVGDKIDSVKKNSEILPNRDAFHVRAALGMVGIPFVRDTAKVRYYKFEMADDSRYQVTEFISKSKAGGVGEVFVCHDNSVLDRKVAIKIFDSGAIFNGKTGYDYARREVAAVKDIPKHPNLVEIHDLTFIANPAFDVNNPDIEIEPFLPVIVMDYVKGPSVEGIDVLNINNDTRICILEDAAGGLDHLHVNHKIHRDFKPGQIVVPIEDDDANWQNKYSLTNDKTERPAIKVLDFETVIDFDELTDLKERISTSGSVEFTSPGVISGDIHRTVDDLWAYAATAFYTFSGIAPYSSRELQKSHSMVNFLPENLRRISEINPNLDPRIANELDQFFLDLFHRNGLFTEANDTASKICENIKKIVTKVRN